MTEQTNSPPADALVIIPTYNERENAPEIIAAVLEQPVNAHILIVDDNSPDGTGELVEQIQKIEPRVHLLKRKGKLGLGSAYIAGFKYALQRGYPCVFEMDADFSHDPAELPRFLQAVGDSDLVIGSRYIKGVNVVNWPLSRLLLSYFASIYVRIITGLPVKDTTGGFKCFRREVLEAIDLDSVTSNGYSFQIELKWLTWKLGFRIREIPITFVDRRVGQSKMSKAIVREAIFLVWRLFFTGLFNGVKRRAMGEAQRTG